MYISMVMVLPVFLKIYLKTLWCPIILLGGDGVTTVTIAMLWHNCEGLCLSYAEKPNKDSEDLQDVQAIREAKENIGDLKLKSDKTFTLPKHLRMNAERKRTELIGLEENVHTHTHRRQSNETSQLINERWLHV